MSEQDLFGIIVLLLYMFFVLYKYCLKYFPSEFKLFIGLTHEILSVFWTWLALSIVAALVIMAICSSFGFQF